MMGKGSQVKDCLARKRSFEKDLIGKPSICKLCLKIEETTVDGVGQLRCLIFQAIRDVQAKKRATYERVENGPLRNYTSWRG
jgi:hypothetical protein